jgi:hypothetical protein
MSSGSFTDEQVHIWLQEVADAGWISLHFDTPALGAVGLAEISGGGYRRVNMIWSQPVNRIIWSLDDARFIGLTQTQLTHFGVWDQQFQGMLRAYGDLPEKINVLNGWGYALKAGELAVSFG